MAKKLRIFFWIGILFILIGIVLLVASFGHIGGMHYQNLHAFDPDVDHICTICRLYSNESIPTELTGYVWYLPESLVTFYLGGMSCLILGVVDLIVVGILWGKLPTATVRIGVPRSQRQ